VNIVILTAEDTYSFVVSWVSVMLTAEDTYSFMVSGLSDVDSRGYLQFYSDMGLSDDSRGHLQFYGAMGFIIHTYSKFLMSSIWRPE
jgi:hypothetical protein